MKVVSRCGLSFFNRSLQTLVSEMSISPKGIMRPSERRRSWAGSAVIGEGIGRDPMTIGDVDETVGVLAGVFLHGGQYSDVVDP